MNYILKFSLKSVLFPFYIVFILLPFVFNYFIFLYYKKRIKIKRKNCLFLINPIAGKRLGKVLTQILKE